MKNENSKQLLLKVLLLFQTIVLVVYTVYVAQTKGWDLLTVFTQNITNLDWNGQFNLDFSSYLTLSALWIIWRNQYTLKSIFIGLACMIIGIMLFAPYLLYLITIEKGDLKRVLIGNR